MVDTTARGASSRLEASVGLLVLLAGAACTPSHPDGDAARDLAERAWGWSSLQPARGNAKRGEYLAAIGACKECHTLRTATGALDMTKLFAGGIPFEGPWGVVASANVSRVAAFMPPAQLEDMIRGRLSYKFQMPTDLYAQIARDDMRDLVAYLGTLQPVERARSANVYAGDFHPPPPTAIEDVPALAPRNPTVERGRYLTVIAICRDCHSPRLADGIQYDTDHLLSGGGFALHIGDGRSVIPPNLTPDPETGLGSWSDAEIVRAIRTGVASDEHQLNPFMPYGVALNALTDDDVEAIVRYLRTLPAVRRSLPENPRWTLGDEARESCCFQVSRADLDQVATSQEARR
jgi:mono/diheme cytochrome c family protein